ncbi:unnamed protein product, partial [Ixodes hexagonus]
SEDYSGFLGSLVPALRLHCDILRFFRNVYSTVYFSALPLCLDTVAPPPPPPFCFLPTVTYVGV